MVASLAFTVAMSWHSVSFGNGLEFLPNGGFENGKADSCPEGWNVVGTKNYRCVDGAGRNGSRGLVFDLTPGCAYGFPTIPLPLKGGSRYRVEGWIRTENIAGGKGWGGGGARIGVDGKTSSGKNISQYSPGVSGTSDGWVKTEMEVEWPVGSSNFAFCAFVERGNTGKAYFDDLHVTEITNPLFGALVSSAYRNVASEGEVDFVVPIRNPFEIEARSVTARFRVSDGNGGWIAHPAMFTNGAARLSVDVAALPFGKRLVQFRATDRCGVTVAEREILFERVQSLPKVGVRFDKQGRTLVDGKPFFPIGMFTHNMCESDANCIGKSPFNVIMSYMDVDEKILDLCHRHDFKVIANLSGAYAGGVPLQLPIIKSVSDEDFLIADKVERMKRHPALLAWYSGDELEIHELGRLTRHRALLESLDPNHPVWTVQCQIDHYAEYLGTYDVGGTDPYPIDMPGSEKNIGLVRNWTRRTLASTFGTKPVWMAIQFFNPVFYGSGKDKNLRAPTEQELRNMCWQAIAEGANGIIIFGYMSLRLEGRESFDKRWPEACRVGQEIRDLSGLLLSDDATASVRVKDSTKGVSVRAWRMNDALHILVVNGSVDAGQCIIEADGTIKTVELKPLEHTICMISYDSL